MDDMCDTLHRLFEGSWSSDVSDDCKSEFVMIWKDAGPARYLLGLLFLSNCRHDTISGL